MNYTFHQLRVFLEVVKQKSVTRAAEEMHMTQPALSIQLRNFQAQFDMPLVEVVNKRIYVTEFGREIAEIAESVLREADEIEFKMKEYQGLLAGKLKISSASTGKYVIPYFLSEFMETHSGVDLVLDVTNKTKVINSMRDNEIDFALVTLVPQDLDVNEEPLVENKLYFVGNNEDFNKDKPLIYREEGSATRTLMERHFGRSKKRKRLELTTTEAVKQAVIAGLGYSVVPLIGIRNELSNGQMRIIPSPGLPIVNKWRLVWRKDKKQSAVAKAYLQYIRDKKSIIVRNSFQWYLDFNEKKRRH